MSRLKRLKLTTAGHDRAMATNNAAICPEMESSQDASQNRQNEQRKGRSLFVRSLPADATSESLTHFFSQTYPLKHATVVIDPVSKKSKGYGFVTFADPDDAQRAKESFNGSFFDGHKIRVENAEPRNRQVNENNLARTPPSKAGPGPQRREFQETPKLIIRNLPWTVKRPEHLAALFRSYGKVKHATLPKTKPGLSSGFGFVVLRGRENAERALEGMNGKEVDGRMLAVDWAVDKKVWETLQNRSDLQGPEAHLDGAIGRDGSIGSEESNDVQVEDVPQSHNERGSSDDDGASNDSSTEDGFVDGDSTPQASGSNRSTLFIRNLPFTCNDEALQGHFQSFGPLRYARVVLDLATERPKGTGFICFYKQEDADICLRGAPGLQLATGQGSTTTNGARGSSNKQSILEDTSMDQSGRYTLEGRVLQVSRAVDRKEAARLTFAGSSLRDSRDQDKRRLYLLSEGTIPSYTPLYDTLSPIEIKMREDSAKQRQSLVRSNPTLHLSLTRLSIRNLPRSLTSKDLKALAREAVVGFAKDVKEGLRQQLSKEELCRGGDGMKQAEKARKARGKGIVKQAKIVFEGREGTKVAEDSGAGRSRGYGFIEYASHRWALMGLRWLNGHALESSYQIGGAEVKERRKRLIAEFAIENAHVVSRRHEREAKARDRSRLVSQKREEGEIPVVLKPYTKNQLMAKTRKGSKRKRTITPELPEQADISEDLDVGDSERLTKRQQIIGRKRMTRKYRRQAASG